ncbi:SDR family oxidoreductase [Arthrobacter sp. 35W]|uniref:SDR family oxidoreductase n=1 Tax=Arthrobacter sp. 35W TaxID=1132441 RepID=UPI0003F63804|nr:SDR family oxidoreductase [Arthrobacter sp. 35W]
MSIVVTGATGQLGRLVVEELLERGIPAGSIVAAGRNAARLGELAERGVQTRTIDFSEPATLREAFDGAKKVLLVSGSEPGQRLDQHQNVIDAAKEAGVELLAYTSVANAGTTTMALAADHQATEAALRESGVPFTLLRNGWYLENYTAQLETFIAHGAVFGSAGEGRVSAATRADFARAAAEVLAGEDHAGKVYELGGDDAFTLGELAGAVGAAAGQPVVYTDLSEKDYSAALVAAGLPEPYAAILADSDLGIARGDLLVTSGDLATLIGRPTESMHDAVRAAFSALAGKAAQN